MLKLSLLYQSQWYTKGYKMDQNADLAILPNWSSLLSVHMDITCDEASSLLSNQF
jgi:hypothetical protein